MQSAPAVSVATMTSAAPQPVAALNTETAPASLPAEPPAPATSQDVETADGEGDDNPGTEAAAASNRKRKKRDRAVTTGMYKDGLPSMYFTPCPSCHDSEEKRRSVISFEGDSRLTTVLAPFPTEMFNFLADEMLCVDSAVPTNHNGVYMFRPTKYKIDSETIDEIDQVCTGKDKKLQRPNKLNQLETKITLSLSQLSSTTDYLLSALSRISSIQDSIKDKENRALSMRKRLSVPCTTCDAVRSHLERQNLLELEEANPAFYLKMRIDPQLLEFIKENLLPDFDLEITIDQHAQHHLADQPSINTALVMIHKAALMTGLLEVPAVLTNQKHCSYKTYGAAAYG